MAQTGARKVTGAGAAWRDAPNSMHRVHNTLRNTPAGDAAGEAFTENAKECERDPAKEIGNEMSGVWKGLGKQEGFVRSAVPGSIVHSRGMPGFAESRGGK